MQIPQDAYQDWASGKTTLTPDEVMYTDNRDIRTLMSIETQPNGIGKTKF